MKNTRRERLINFFGGHSRAVSEQPVSKRPAYDTAQAIRDSIFHGVFGPSATTVCISYTDLDYLTKYCGLEINTLEVRLSSAETEDQKLAAYKQFGASVKSHGFTLDDKGSFLHRTEQSPLNFAGPA